MSNSMVSTVLEIEREAEDILAKAEREAADVIAKAKADRTDNTAKAEENVKQEIADLEAKAAAERDTKVRELSATGEAALTAVKNISDAAFDSGVQHILAALAEK